MQPDEGLFTRQVPGDRYRQQTDPVLQLENINVSFDGFQALTNLTLNIGVGELRCDIGPNGAGKTTLMDVITGKTRPQSGKALRVFGTARWAFRGQGCVLDPADRAAFAEAARLLAVRAMLQENRSEETILAS